MKAVLCREWGGPESLRFEEVASPPLAAHQARIRVRACGVNFADTLMIAGKYQVKPDFPFTPRPGGGGRGHRGQRRGQPSAAGATGARGVALWWRLCRGDRDQRRCG